jgi:hypothetical protein
MAPRLLAVLVAAIAVSFMQTVQPVGAVSAAHVELNACDPCQDLPGYQCGVVILNAITNCCGSGGSGNASCNEGLDPDAYAVACNGGGGCICGDWGDDCVQVG